MFDGVYAEFSPALPKGWASAEMVVIEAMPFMADSKLENAGELNGNIALVSRDTEELELLRSTVSFCEKAKRASEAGAVGVIIVNTTDNLPHSMADDGSGYKSNIPVLMIKPSDVVRLREHGSALILDKGGLTCIVCIL